MEEAWNFTTMVSESLTWQFELNSTNNGDNSSGTESPTSPKPYISKIPKCYYPVLMSTLAASILCLTATIFIYCKLPEFKNIPGKNLISLSTCLLITYVLLIIDFMTNRFIPKTPCKILGVFTHLSFLSVFMWTNVMSFDIWQTVISSHRPSAPQSRRFKYWKYSIYAWLGTIVLALPAVIVDSTRLLNKTVSPSFGTRRCWLNGTPAFLIYFNAPVGLILITNFTFFGLTARALVNLGKMTAKMNMNQHRKRFHLYLKLFIIMGMVWISEFIPWITGFFPLYMVAGIVTSLYGVFLFAIFICKRKVLKSMRIVCFKTYSNSASVKNISQSCRNGSITPGQTTQSSFSSSTATCIGVSEKNISFNTHI